MQKSKIVLPGETIGIIGGGQLGRMMALEARYMGYRVIVLDPTPNCPTGQVSDEQILAPYDDLEAIKELTEKSDVITYEFENVDLSAARYIEEKGKLPQGADLLDITQNRDKEKMFLSDLDIPVSAFRIISEEREVKKAVEEIGYPAVIKTTHGGYDGKGQFKIATPADLPLAQDFVREREGKFIVEKWLSFDREISVILTRSKSGEVYFFPLAENIHQDHILDVTIAPAGVNETVREGALEIAEKIARELKVLGSFAIELFVLADEVFVNELAPRPHNSGHYTIEACNVNQFDQHIRAICGLPLQEVRQVEAAAMKNILGEQLDPLLGRMPQLRDGFVHLYGKEEAKEKRKMGHVTFTAETAEKVKEALDKLEEAIQ